LRLSPAATIRILHVVLWVLVASGPLAALVVATQLSSFHDRLDAVAARPTSEPATDTTGAEGVAALFIASYLAADGDSTDGVEAAPWTVTRTVNLGAEEVAAGYFAVTVAVDLSTPTGLATWFYLVGVARTANGWTVTGAPALVAAPPSDEVPTSLVDQREGVDLDPGIDALLTGFLSAYLTGDGELTRYTSPTAAIASVQPAPFTQIEVLAAGAAEASDGLTPVAVTVRATDLDGRTQVLEYSLMVSQRDGRWEVSELFPAPLLAPSDTN
jgi:hypothetical protein